MTKEVLMQEVKRVANLLKVDSSNLSDAELFSMVTGVTVASFDEVTEDRLAFLYKLIPGGAFVDNADDAAVEGEGEEPTVNPVADDEEPTVNPVADDEEPTVNPVADDEEPVDDEPAAAPVANDDEPEVEPEAVEDDEKSEATVEE